MQDPQAIHHPDVNEESIALLVRTFYGRAREDELIGPIFNALVADWDHHIAKIADFWSSVLLRTSRYDGRPLRPHLRMPIEGRHFDRWLEIFADTARDIYPPDIADFIILRSRRIADSFEMSIATQRGEIASPRHAV
jgi:hemoglobin